MNRLGLALIACTVLVLDFLSDVSHLDEKTKGGWNWTATFVCLWVAWTWHKERDR